jgi:cysteine-rich CPXCG protein
VNACDHEIFHHPVRLAAESALFDPNDIEDNDEPGNVQAFPQDVVFDTEAEVVCPCCGEKVVIGLDPDGGATQEYVEDCQVCCRPWRVRVSYDETGAADVQVEEGQ